MQSMLMKGWGMPG